MNKTRPVETRASAFRKRPLLWFFLLTFLISPVLLLTPGLMAKRGGPDWLAPLGEVLVSWAPNIAAVIVTGVACGWPGIRRLLAGFLRWRAGWGWYAVAVFGPVIVAYLVAAVYYLSIGRSEGMLPGFGLAALSLTVLNHWIRGPMGEEAGWRGFALPILQARYSPLKASLSLGVVWSVWHFPFWLFLVMDAFPGEPGRMVLMFASLALVVPALSVIMAWMYNHTQGSLLLAMLFHLSFNVANGLFRMPWDVQFAVLAVVYTLVAAAIVATGGRHLSRTPENGTHRSDPMTQYTVSRAGVS